MRILFVSHYALPHLGGIEVAIDAVARELVRRGHEVTHLASAARRPGEPEAEEAPYRVLRVGAVDTLERRTGAPWPLFGPGLVRELRRALPRVDVVHAHGFLYMSSLAALRAARARGDSSPVRVLSEHVGHVPYDSRVLDRVEALAIATLGRATVRAAEGLVHLNEGVAAQLAALAPDRPLWRIDNGVDLERFRPPEPGERERLRAELGWDETPRVLFVGRLVAKKGLDVALATAAEGRFELVLAGPGEAPSGTESLGTLPQARLAEVYRAADALLLPSRGEGFPLVVQEAMASGLPAVLADDPAYAGLGDGVRLLPPDAKAMALALRELLDDPGSGAAAAEHARAKFSWTAAADRHEQLYEELAERRSSNPSRSSSRSTGPRARVP